MKIHPLLSACLALLLLVLAVSGGEAQSELLASNLTFSRQFLYLSTNYDTNAWWQSHTVVDAAGKVHATFYTAKTIVYATCTSNCGNAASWTKVTLASAGDYSSLAFPSIALDPSGRPRMMWYIQPNFIYAECNSACTIGSNWKFATVPLNPDNYSKYPRSSRYFSLDEQGRPRFVSQFYKGITYATCDLNCTISSSWKYFELDFGSSNAIDVAQLVMNTSGQPRLVGVNDYDQITYAQCNQNCTTAANWSLVKLGDGVGNLSREPIYSMRIDPQGRPRIAYYKANSSDKNMYYAWSNTNFTSAANWSTDTLPLPPATDRTLDMAIDSNGNPHIVYANENFDLKYARCYSACNTMNSEWWLQDVETGDQLNAVAPITPTPGYIDLGWWIDGYPSLALGPGDSPYVSYFARNVQAYNTRISNNAWSIRFATARSLGRKLYLPLTRR